jgi:RNA polymerase sigma factor (sigma-70 family)
MGASDRISIESLLQHDSWLRGLATHLASDSSEAEDLVQETWLAALRRPPAQRSNDIRGWLSRVARNVKLQSSREGGRRAQRESVAGQESNDLGVPTPVEIESAIELRQLLLDELAQLDEPLRVVLAMRYLEGLSIAELAERAGMPTDTAKSRISRGLQQLRERLDRRDGGRAHWVALCAPVGTSVQPTLPTATPISVGTLLMTSTTKLAWTALVLVLAIAAAYVLIDAEELESTGSLAPAVGVLTPPKALPDSPALLRSDIETPPAREVINEDAPSPLAAKPLVAGPGETLGQVIDVKGDAIAGVDVRSTRKPVQIARTDAFGLFVWRVLDEPQMLATVSTEWVCVSRGTAVKEIDSPLILVVAEPALYAGVVRDEKGVLLPNVELMLQLDPTWSRHLALDLSAGNQQRWHATSDENGVFRMESVPSLKEATLWLQRDGRTGLYQAPGETREDLQLVLRMTRRTKDERWASIPHMAGRVLSNTGDPLEGAEVRAGSFTAETAPDGSFRVPYSTLDEATRLRVIQKGVLPMDVFPPGALTDAHGGWPEFMELRMHSLPPPSIRGWVLTSKDEPVEDCTVWLTNLTALDDSLYPDYLEESLGDVKCSTLADGSFRLTVVPGESYVLGVFDREDWRMIESGPVVPGDHEVLLVLPDPLGNGDVHGLCVDTKGHPVAQVEIGPRWSVELGSGSREYGSVTTKSDADGFFVLREQQLGFNSFYCEGSPIMPQLVEVDPFHQSTYRVEVKRRARLHVTSHIETEHWPTFMIYDDQGNAQELYLFQRIAKGDMEGANITSWGELTDGVSPAYSLSEGSYELRFMDGDKAVVRRVPIVLVAGETLELIVD